MVWKFDTENTVLTFIGLEIAAGKGSKLMDPKESSINTIGTGILNIRDTTKRKFGDSH
jgi:hypothetical protein